MIVLIENAKMHGSTCPIQLIVGTDVKGVVRVCLSIERSKQTEIAGEIERVVQGVIEVSILIVSVESEEGAGKETILFDLEVEVRGSEDGWTVVLIFDDQLQRFSSLMLVDDG